MCRLQIFWRIKLLNDAFNPISIISYVIAKLRFFMETLTNYVCPRPIAVLFGLLRFFIYCEHVSVILAVSDD